MKKFNAAQKIALIYLIISVIWITCSDRALLLFSLEPGPLTVLQSLKGWLFVIFTSLLLYYLIHKDYLVNEQLGREIMKNNENLNLMNARLLEEIEERKAIEASLIATQKSLEEANRAKTQFLANMSHEIRTPMNGIMGMIQLLLMEDATETQTEYLKMAMTSASSLMYIINDILDISRIELGAMQLNNQPFMLRELIERILDMFTVNAMSKQLKLEYEIEPGVPPELIGDQNRLGQVLINLIGNAIKFTDHGSVSLRVSLSGKKAEKRCVKFEVIDTGIGIAKKDIDKLFKSFSQVDDSNQRKYGGTGLGLAISSNLVKMMDGEITVESKLGAGSTFTFYGWLGNTGYGRAETDGLADRDSCNENGGVKNALRILVVEDNKVNQMITKELLEKRGYEVSVADNGIRALEIQGSDKHDLLVMDIQMPEMDGLQATKALRSRGDSTPVIAVTAYAMKNDMRKCIDAGMDEYLAKPFTVEELYNKIDNIMGNEQLAI